MDGWKIRLNILFKKYLINLFPAWNPLFSPMELKWSVLFLAFPNVDLLYGECIAIYLSTTRISTQYHPWYIIFDLQRISLEQKLISHGYFRTWMHILRVNVTFYDAVNIIHDVITTRNPFPYTAKFMFDGVRNNETQQIRRWKINRII